MVSAPYPAHCLPAILVILSSKSRSLGLGAKPSAQAQRGCLPVPAFLGAIARKRPLQLAADQDGIFF